MQDRTKERFCQSGVKVFLTDKPSRRGETTGNCKNVGTRLYVEIRFGPNERAFKDASELSEDTAERDPFKDAENSVFGTGADLRRMLTFEKLRGHLTNVFYSMESSNTDFYPHQFKPVLKFLESTEGRLLIADEVGLGKTIEAAYIWKELQARENARRLLIVCPSVLRQKWRDDLSRKFSVRADILSAKEFHAQIKDFTDGGTPEAFVSICSLEGIRTPSNFADENSNQNAAKIGRILDRSRASEDRALFDLVIIDEAHYMRTPGTSSNRLGNLLRDASRHLILLTATPVQIDSENLYQILRLVSPDSFFNKQAFDEIVHANKPVTTALRALWSDPPNIETSRRAVEEALRSPFFASNRGLQAVRDGITSEIISDRSKKIDLGRVLENASLLGQFMSRSRKRDVIENRVERGAQTLIVNFTDEEKRMYDHVSMRIREQSKGLSGPPLFSLILRQAQMASCLVAALKGWTSNGAFGETIWDALGLALDTNDGQYAAGGDAFGIGDAFSAVPACAAEIDALKKNDSKYEQLRGHLRKTFEKNPAEKAVIFAFFRGTLSYLQERLKQDGIRAALIMGGMGEEKWDVIREFAKPDGPNILLSSEVGSEGIDLQFCRTLVNYDLPWNPMRVEQRIGRLDRLGQKAEQISIINFSLRDTVEARILERLYDRIELFKESIGDMEEILGNMTEKLITELFEPSLTEEQRKKRADQIADTVIRKRKDQSKLEAEAVNMLAFSDYVLDAVRESKNSGRWLQPSEIAGLVKNFLSERYPGTDIQPVEGRWEAAAIHLSDEAQSALRSHRRSKATGPHTKLDRTNQPVVCVFDPKSAGDLGKGKELIDPAHPLLRWVREGLESDMASLHRTCAVRAAKSDAAPYAEGLYAVTAHEWSFTGIKREQKIVFRAQHVGDEAAMGAAESEHFVNWAVADCAPWFNAGNTMPDKQQWLKTLERCENLIFEDYIRASDEFKYDNDARCNVQEESARRFAARKIGDYEARIENFTAEGKNRMIPATQGLIDSEKRALSDKLGRIDGRRKAAEADTRLLFIGAVLVE